MTDYSIVDCGDLLSQSQHTLNYIPNSRPIAQHATKLHRNNVHIGHYSRFNLEMYSIFPCFQHVEITNSSVHLHTHVSHDAKCVMGD